MLFDDEYVDDYGLKSKKSTPLNANQANQQGFDLGFNLDDEWAKKSEKSLKAISKQQPKSDKKKTSEEGYSENYEENYDDDSFGSGVNLDDNGKNKAQPKQDLLNKQQQPGKEEYKSKYDFTLNQRQQSKENSSFGV